MINSVSVPQPTRKAVMTRKGIRMSEPNDFGKSIQELLGLLKKILKSQKSGNVDLSALMDKKNLNLNLCFFTFLPMTEEDFAEFEEEMEGSFTDEHSGDAEDLRFEINTNDAEFLKSNGIKF